MAVIRLSVCLGLLGIALTHGFALPAAAQTAGPAARAAEIVKAVNTVEVRRGATGAWTAARSGQELQRGDAVRTHPLSVAQLTFVGGVQWQLAEASELNLEEALAGGAGSIVVRLERGGAVSRWTPDRRGAASPMLTVRTPSGQAGITGTEWSMRVEPEGRTALLVLEGSVALSNDRGMLVVHANEAGEMRLGQAPSRLQVVTPRDRVQWVAAYVAAPRRYAANAAGPGRAMVEEAAATAAAGKTVEAIEALQRRVDADAAIDAAAQLALTDLLMEAGSFDRARSVATAGRARYPDDARFDALLSRIALFEDRPDESRAAAEAATAKDPQSVDGWLALGQWATWEGDARLARGAFSQATELGPEDARGWFGLGSVSTELDEFPAARRLLRQALTLDPDGTGYRGELGRLETLANRLTVAAREFSAALEQRADDYVTLTGRALLALKQGREAEALELLERAILLEPRYAVAHMYLGVTYYRLRRVDDAIRALERASREDPRDPMPYMMLTQIYTDVFEPSKAVAAARAARERMPYLKSLNQLSNTVKGGANLGNALAFFGLEEWATHLAQESYTPLWAGSHLFLGDRYPGAYARTSEYYQGLLADSTVFGGSPRFQTLLQRPGVHATADYTSARDEDALVAQTATVSVNGYANARMPLGFAVSARGGSGRAERAVLDEPVQEARSPYHATASIGMAPTPRWSLFAVGARASTRQRIPLEDTDEGPIVARWSLSGSQVDVGTSYRMSPSSSLGGKVSVGRSRADLPIGRLVPLFRITSAPVDAELRYVAVAGRHEIGAGFDLAIDRQRIEYTTLSQPFVVSVDDLRSRRGFVSTRMHVGAVMLQGEVFAGAEDVDEATDDLIEPRAGASVRLGAGVLRAGYQRWTRPLAAVGTLAPVATAGIPLDESLTPPGARVDRVRVQFEREWTPRLFTSVFGDRAALRQPEDFTSTTLVEFFQQNVVSSSSAIPDPSRALFELRNITRDASRLNVAAVGQLERVPRFLTAEASAVGAAFNAILAPHLSVASQYRFSTGSSVAVRPISRESYEVEYAPGALAYVPRHLWSLGATWVSPKRVYASAQVTRRGERTEDFDSAHILLDRSPIRRPDWTSRLAAAWESPAKRWTLEVSAAHLPGVQSPTSYRVTLKHRQ